MGKGNDKKQWFIRTNWQVAIDNKLQTAGFRPVGWEHRTEDFNKTMEALYLDSSTASVLDSRRNGERVERATVEPVVLKTPPVTPTLKGFSVETVELESVEPTEQGLELSVTKQVLDVVYAELEKRTADILNRYKPRNIVQAIKVNELPQVKTDHEPHEQLPYIIALLKNRQTPLLSGPAGCGKTLLAEQCAQALNLDFGHLCFSVGVSETWLFGRQTPAGFVEGEFSRLYREGGVFLADELDAADPNLLLAINTALANGHLYNPISGQNIKRHEDFYFIATANTLGKGGNQVYTGRARLDGATLDRFIIVTIGYVANIEEALCSDSTILNLVRSMRAHVDKNVSPEIISYRTLVKAATLNAMGVCKTDIVKTLTAAWPDELKDSFEAA